MSGILNESDLYSDNMKTRIYIETSVVSYLTARPSSNTIIAGHQASTQLMWDMIGKDFDPYISDLVIQEVAEGDKQQARLRKNAIENFPALDIDNEVEKLAGLFLQKKTIPRDCPEDSLHIAVACVNALELIVTWNFRHINNPMLKHTVRKVVEEAGYEMPGICSPDELIGGGT